MLWLYHEIQLQICVNFGYLYNLMSTSKNRLSFFFQPHFVSGATIWLDSVNMVSIDIEPVSKSICVCETDWILINFIYRESFSFRFVFERCL